MPDFSKRSEAVEIMDDLQCSGEVVKQTLRELETINDLLGGNYVTIDALVKLTESSKNRTLSIADLGCGSGDILRLIWKHAQKEGNNHLLTGIDANPFIIEFAKNRTPPDLNIQFEAINILNDDFKKRNFDVVIGTLFFHHFSNETLISFLRQLKHQVNIGFIVNDIHRHWLAYYSIKWLTRLLSKSAMVKNDAPLSVMRAFRKKELISILEKAGIERYSIRWMWAFRWQIIVKTD